MHTANATTVLTPRTNLSLLPLILPETEARNVLARVETYHATISVGVLDLDETIREVILCGDPGSVRLGDIPPLANRPAAADNLVAIETR
jgi:hypothetical protein